jgi:hypothetical protein
MFRRDPGRVRAWRALIEAWKLSGQTIWVRDEQLQTTGKDATCVR